MKLNLKLKKLITVLLTVSMLLSILQIAMLTTAATSTIIPVGDKFSTLEDAIAEANTITGAVIIEIHNNITVTKTVIITSDVTIISVKDAHKITGGNFEVQNGGSLTLGDGTNTNTLTITSVKVTNGAVNICDGVVMNSSGNTLFLSGPSATGTISGGHITGNVAVSIEKGAQISEISGGKFYGKQDTVYITDKGTKIHKISGGAFYQTDTSVTLHGHTIFLQDDAQIGEISGGYFEAIRNAALVVIRGGWVNEIGGGDFVAIRKGTQQDGNAPDSWNSVLRVQSEQNFKTGIGTISGGHFHGGARFGILVINAASSTTGARIDAISGGTIQGAVVGLQVDQRGNVGEISGGTITGLQGMLNAGTIEKISGNVAINGATSYAIVCV